MPCVETRKHQVIVVFVNNIKILSWTHFLQQESLALKENLLKDFLPDDACPLGAELFAEEPEQLYQANNKDNKALDEVFVFTKSKFSLFLNFK